MCLDGQFRPGFGLHTTMMPLFSDRPRSEDDGTDSTNDAPSQLASDGLATVFAEYADTVADNLQVIGGPGQRMDDGDLICPQIALNVTEAHNFDARHGNFNFIHGSQTNVFSKTTNTVTYINARA